MREEKAAALLDLDWSKFEGATPTEGVVYPRGDKRADLRARMRRVFAKFRLRQVA